MQEQSGPLEEPLGLSRPALSPVLLLPVSSGLLHVLPRGKHWGDAEGQGCPAAASLPYCELAHSPLRARDLPSEAWASWGMFVG